VRFVKFIVFIFALFLFSCIEDSTPPTQDDVDPSMIDYKPYSLDSLTGKIIDTDIMIEDFSSASTCKDCHQAIYDEWSNSFHALSFNDPIFMSMWSSEKAHRPETGKTYCIQCHAPAAFVTGYSLDGIENTSDIQNSDIPDIIKEGVSCDICHTMVDKSPSVRTEDHVAAVAQYYLNPGEDVKYGSIQDPDCGSSSSQGHTDCVYLPLFNSSSSCKPCHNQFIREMPIEATFSEWDNHPGLAMGGPSCQNCHMPKNGSHSSHYFAGADLLFYDGVDVYSDQYQQVTNLLKQAVTIDFEYSGGSQSSYYIENDILYFPILITNMTGHRLPSGTPFSREVWLEIIVISDTGEVVFQKGVLNNSSEELNYDDSDLVFYTAILYDQENLEGNIIYEPSNALSYDDRTLRTLFYDQKMYELDVSNVSGQLTVYARMLFRPFKPQMLSEFHPSSMIHLPIIEMYSDTLLVTIP